MLKTKLGTVIGLSLLCAGLTSCSPDTQNTSPTKPFRAPPPRIMAAGENTDLRDIERLSSRTLDIRDKIDFSKAQAASITIKSSCAQGGEVVGSDTVITGQQPVEFMRLIPVQLLASDLNKINPMCAFEVQIANREGSKHIFSLINIKFVEMSSSEVSVEGTNVRFSHSGSATAQILCSDIKVPVLPFEQVRALGDFDFQNAELYTRRDPQVLEKNRRQSCRVAIFQEQQVVALSPAFEHLLALPALQVKVSAVESLEPVGRSLNLGTIEITNPSSIARRVRIPNQAWPVRLQAHWALKGVEQTCGVEFNGLSLGSARSVEIAAGQTVYVPASVVVRLPLASGLTMQLARDVHVATEAIQLSEVDESGGELDKVTVPPITTNAAMVGQPNSFTQCRSY